mgnify:CR=1 FL=1
MSFLAFLLLGLVAGAIAKAILPGKQGGGWFITLLLGVVGALLGGWIGGTLFGVGFDGFFSLQAGSVALDYGNTALVPAGTTIDGAAAALLAPITPAPPAASAAVAAASTAGSPASLGQRLALKKP